MFGLAQPLLVILVVQALILRINSREFLRHISRDHYMFFTCFFSAARSSAARFSFIAGNRPPPSPAPSSLP